MSSCFFLRQERKRGLVAGFWPPVVPTVRWPLIFLLYVSPGWSFTWVFSQLT